MANRVIDSNFWTTPNWDDDIDSAPVPGFAFFTDGDLQYVVTRSTRCEMDVIHRTATELFSKTVEDNCAAAFPSAAINGSFGDASNVTKAINSVGNDPIDPDLLQVTGDVIINRARSPVSDSEPEKAFVAYDVESAPVSRRYQLGIGNPPTDARAALGGLGPVIIGGRKFSANKSDPNYSAWYLVQASRGASNGKVFVAISPDDRFILLLVQPDGAPSALELDIIRDKLFLAGTQNAVFLDGSSSVMLFVAGEWKVRQSRYKNKVTSIGLRFHFQPAVT